MDETETEKPAIETECPVCGFEFDEKNVHDGMQSISVNNSSAINRVCFFPVDDENWLYYHLDHEVMKSAEAMDEKDDQGSDEPDDMDSMNVLFWRALPPTWQAWRSTATGEAI